MPPFLLILPVVLFQNLQDKYIFFFNFIHMFSRTVDVLNTHCKDKLFQFYLKSVANTGFRKITFIHLKYVQCFVDGCLSFCSLFCGHCAVCPPSIYGFLLPLWHLQSFFDHINTVVRLTDTIYG
jgi:hypothetical protein